MRDESDTSLQAQFDANKLKDLVEFFPIGKALRYSPDPGLVVVFDTLIVAYCINQQFIYSRNAIQSDGDGNPVALALEEQGSRLSVDGIREFQLLVPDTTGLEGALDYDRRALIGRAQQFIKDHVITLMAGAGARGLATLTTRVAAQLTLPDGPYANSRMVLLSPEFGTLSVTDRFHKSRGKTHVPVDLYFKKDVAPYSCVISDFSEASLGLHSIDNQPTMPSMEPEDTVTIVIDLGARAKTYTVKGRVFRRSSDSCIVRLEELFKGHEFSRFGLLDALELKTGLLNYGN